MSLLKTNEIQNYNGSSLTLTASTVSTSAQLNTGGNISVTGSLNVSDDSTTRTNLGLGSMATQNANSVAITGGTINTVQPATGQSLTIKDEDGNTAITIGTDNTAASYLSLNFGSYHNGSGGAVSSTLIGNTLDDYETGTFLPTLGDGSNFHTLDSSEKGGVYVKIGDFVTCYGITKISTINTSVTTHNIYLPFTCYSYPSSIIANVSGSIVSRYINYPQDYLTCYISEGTNYLQIVSPRAGTYNPISFDYTAVNVVTAWFIFSISYKVA